MKKILIIEDEQTLVKALQESLSDGNYVVETSLDGEDGVEKIREFKPDLVLLDLILPKMDGFSVLQKIKEDPELLGVKVLVLTNLSDVSDRVMQLGATDCLIKSDSSVDKIQSMIREKLGG